MQEEEKSATLLETIREHLLTEGTLSYSKRIEDPEKYKNTKFKIQLKIIEKDFQSSFFVDTSLKKWPRGRVSQQERSYISDSK